MTIVWDLVQITRHKWVVVWLPHTPNVEQVFAKMDSNNDDQLSESQVQSLLKNMFTQVDTNGDGYISKDELNNASKPPKK